MPCESGPLQRSDFVTPDMDMAIPALCAVFTVLERSGTLSGVLDAVDWKEAGKPRKQIEEWWARHKVKDAQRRRREARAAALKKERKMLLASAKSKLTQKELQALRDAARG